MTRNLFTPNSIEDAVIELDTFRNDILGVAAFSFGITALQFQANQASSIATVALVFLLLWAYLKLWPKIREHKRLYDNLDFWDGNLRMLRANFVFLTGVIFLGLVAGEILTLDRLHSISIAKVFDYLSR